MSPIEQGIIFRTPLHAWAIYVLSQPGHKTRGHSPDVRGFGCYSVDYTAAQHVLQPTHKDACRDPAYACYSNARVVRDT